MAARGAIARSSILLHSHRLPRVAVARIGAGRAGRRGRGVGVRVFARSSQAQDFSTRIQDRASELPKLVEDLLQTSISTGPRGAFRMAQGIQAVLGVGGEWLTDFSKTANTSAGIPAQIRLGLLSPLYLRRLFERMGATYIKLGQVHGARLKSSQKDVVIKVLKPGIEDTLVADLNFIYVVARVLEFLNPELQRTSLVGIVKDIKESMLEEVDFRKEAANIEAFQRYIEAMGFDRQAKAPFVYRHCSTKHVLTMERLYGVPLTDLESIRSLVPDPELTLVTALNAWFGSLISCESFHADVHAGNLWLLRDGQVGFIDFGIVGRISPRTWAAMEVFLASFATEDYDAMASALSEMGATGTDINVNEFAKDLQKIFSSIQDLDTEIIVATARGHDATAVSANVVVDERQMNALFLDLVRVSESYGLKFPREFALLMKQLLYFDRYTRLLAPSMNMLRDDRIIIASNRQTRIVDRFQ
ncbi:hypothetical protein PR202_ga27925 [Eleusine coracana subsp. coracana]|uniref:ABC1 atypical kinase-like domain-containing protein n=1 Tax=Eleusine coracana subsp. coracana TaxID=191504 RepID=A0AAV5DHX8_ELECO|nr:hypothetical protein PR202_ga27925 [Eleusine coracana subsp. coracana]